MRECFQSVEDDVEIAKHSIELCFGDVSYGVERGRKVVVKVK